MRLNSNLKVVIGAAEALITLYLSLMPHLEICSRYWRISLDDFPIPAGLGLVVQSVQFVLLVIVLESVTKTAEKHMDCEYERIIAYLIVSILTSLLLMGVGVATIYLGLKGHWPRMISVSLSNYA